MQLGQSQPRPANRFHYRRRCFVPCVPVLTILLLTATRIHRANGFGPGTTTRPVAGELGVLLWGRAVEWVSLDSKSVRAISVENWDMS